MQRKAGRRESKHTRAIRRLMDPDVDRALATAAAEHCSAACPRVAEPTFRAPERDASHAA